jgi:endonuclease YncB( thermonuclease family)
MQTVTGQVTRVRDGDTIEVAGHPIRLGRLDCNERGSRSGDTATSVRGKLYGHAAHSLFWDIK